MEEEERDADRNTRSDNAVTVLLQFKKGGHGTSLFVFWFFLFIWFLGLAKQAKQTKYTQSTQKVSDEDKSGDHWCDRLYGG
jgi:hypothetical protein